MKKVFSVLVSLLLLLIFSTPSALAAESNICDQYKGIDKVWWNGMELKSGQIGRLTVLKDTSLFKLNGDKKVVSRTLKKGEFYRIYAFKPGMVGVGGGYYVNRDSKVKYESPSKTKLQAVKCINGGFTYSTKEIVDINDEKIVLININNNSAQGSGIVIGNGLILTNYHVMEGAREATVTFISGQKYTVEGIVDSDSTRDIAIIKTTKSFSTPGVSFRDNSTGLSKGDKVVAIGNPLGLQNTVSEGIISSFRTENGVKLIQTNADIDHGSSGGGLFNINGQLIGITSAGYDGSSANLNFAIAPEEYVPMINKYIKLPYSSIAASFPDYSTSLLGDVALGMSKQQVKNLSTGTLSKETTTELYFNETDILGYSATTIYEFANDKLVSVTSFHDGIAGQEPDILEEYFLEMYQSLSQIYGEADELDTDWYDDDDGYSLNAYWESVDHVTLLTVKMTIDYDTYGAIRVQIYNY